MQPVIRRSKNRVGGLEMQIKKEPWYKRLFDKILVSCFLSCRHEWEVLEVLWTLPGYSGFKYEVCKCGCKKCGEISIEQLLV